MIVKLENKVTNRRVVYSSIKELVVSGDTVTMTRYTSSMINDSLMLNDVITIVKE